MRRTLPSLPSWTIAMLVPFALVSGDAAAQCTDRDGDGYGRPGDASCPAGPETDCNDRDADAYPGAFETCDGADTNCDGMIDSARECNGLCEQPTKMPGATSLPDAAPHDRTVHKPIIVWNGSDFGVVWDQDPYDDCRVYYTRVASSGEKIGDTVPLTSAGTRSRYPDMVWTGSEYGVVWVDRRDGQDRSVYFARFDKSGSRISAEVRLSGKTGNAFSSKDPHIAWSGKEYAVVWHNYREEIDGPALIFQRLSAGGERIGNALTATEGTVFTDRVLGVTWTGSQYGITWLRNDTAAVDDKVMLTRVDSTGRRIGASTVVATDELAWDDWSAGPEWTGSEYGVFWHVFRDGSSKHIYFQRVSAQGVNLGERVELASDPVGGLWLLDYAWNGDEYGMLWYHADHVYDYRIRFSRVSRTGTLLGDSVYLQSGLHPWRHNYIASLDWNGSDWGIAYWEHVNDLTDVLYTRIDCDCTDLDGDFVCTSGDCDDADPAIWGPPSEPRELHIAVDRETLTWREPREPGANEENLVYDTLRSEQAFDFSSAGVCIESDDGPNTESTDAEAPPTAGAYYYLVRAENPCPEGEGELGWRSDGQERLGRECP